MLSSNQIASNNFTTLKNEFESLKVMSNHTEYFKDLDQDFETETETTILNVSNMLREVFSTEFNIEFDSSDDVIFNYLRDMTTYQDQTFDEFWVGVQNFYEDEICVYVNRPNLTIIENQMLRLNQDKEIEFVDGLGNIVKGYIKGANKMFGNFHYEVSKSKKPRSEFNIGGGTWYAVNPMNIIH